MTQQHNLESFVSGDSLHIPIEFQRDGNALDLTNWTVWFTMKHSGVQPDSEAVLQITQSLSGADTILYVSPAQSRELIAKTYDYDIQIVSPDQSVVTTLVIGKIEVLQGVSAGA